MNQFQIKILFDIINQRICEDGFIIIPSLGMFFLEYQSAQFNDKQGLFLPPRYIIKFNSRIKHNDGELVICLSKALKINYFDAYQYIKDFAQYLEYEVKSQKEFTISDIGKFFVKEDNLVFQANESFLSPMFYGLKPLPVVSHELLETTIFSYPEIQKRRLHNWIKAAVVLPLFLAISLLPTKTNYYDFENVEASFFSKRTINEQVHIVEPSLERVIDTMTNIKMALTPKNIKFDSTSTIKSEQTKNLEQKDKVQQTIQKPTKQYYIVIASFTTEKQVENFKKLVKEIENELITLNCDGRLRVAYRSFNSLEEANESLKRLKEQYPTINGWILHW